MVHNVPVQTGLHTLSLSMYILPVAAVDVVIGTAWLEILGPHVADYSTSTIKFLQDGQFVTLVGYRASPVLQAEFHHLLRFAHMDANAEFYVLDSSPSIDPVFQISVDMDQSLAAVLLRFQQVFSVPHGLPHHRCHEYRIVLDPATKPIRVKPYRYPISQKIEIERIVNKLLWEGHIQPSISPFSAPVILVKKKDGTWRFCIDYRALNATTVKDAFPMPTVDELIDELYGFAFPSKLDLHSSYHQILMCESNRDKTAFRTHQGSYEWLVMPFGLTNTPATFQALMNSIFQPHLRLFVLIFFDDILVYNSSWDLHLQHVAMVLSILADNRLYAKFSKCSCGQCRIAYLGHIVSVQGIEMDDSKIRAVLD